MSPQIQTAKINPIRKLVFLTFDDGSYFPISLEDHLRHLPTDNLPASSVHHLLSNYALRQIAISSRTEKIIRQKLSAYFQVIIRRYRYFDLPQIAATIDSIVDYLNSRALINSQDYINQTILRHRHHSSRHIVYLLRQAGLTDSQVAPFRHQLFQSDIVKARTLALKKPGLSAIKLYSWLANKGFTEDTIKTVIDELTKSS